MWNGLQVTGIGIKLLDELNTCEKCHTKKELYSTHGFTQTSQTYGYKSTGWVQLCECEKKDYLERSALSRNSNHKFGLGEKITPRQLKTTGVSQV